MGLKRRKRLNTSRGSRAGAVLLLSLTLLVAFSSIAAANEFSAGLRTRPSADLDGLRGNQGIRTGPATVNGVGFNHITQMDVGSSGASFVAVGTYNGKGTSGHAQDCADDYDSGWSGYYDGEIAGVYFCQKFGDDNWGVGDSPAFRIERDCPLGPNTRWGLYFAGTMRACIDSGSSGAIFADAGIEAQQSGTTDRNIDVKYTSLDVNFSSGGTWSSFNRNDSVVNPNYSLTDVSSTAFNTFLAPLD